MNFRVPRVIALIVFGASSACLLAQRPYEPPAHVSHSAREFWAPLGLPRLRAKGHAGESPVLTSDRFQVENLEAEGANHKIERRQNLRILSLAPGARWRRPLRSSGQPVFVSLQVNASIGTQIQVGEVRIAVVASPIANYSHMMFAEGDSTNPRWRPLGTHISFEQYGAKTLSSLPVLTVFRDPITSTWSLYADAKLVLERAGLPRASAGASDVSLSAGDGGAWLIGVTQSSANPLVEDENMNAIDDAFERKAIGQVLPHGSSVELQKQLTEKWRREPRNMRPVALRVERPLPDRLVAERNNP